MTTHLRVALLFLPILVLLTGCAPSRVDAPSVKDLDVPTRLLHAGFRESKTWKSLGNKFVQYRRAVDDEVTVHATVCSAWTMVTVRAPQSAIDDVDRITRAIREGEEAVALIVNDANALTGLYANENRVPYSSGINRTEHKMVSGNWSIQAVRYLSVAKNADRVTLATFTLRPLTATLRDRLSLRLGKRTADR
ncbi:secreted protein [Rhodopirellula maiorica SM1]|uniref:Secreted protein n=1 Tax=Rhodopirellula maiorica SM1 TaxID=1265738 RepID=M5R9F2_9BACT|nr:hypothetical protein [Rhodopirellula maiorica]EMI16123.1 secreted protein [Rhodopirellula maiorica SM1]